MKRIHTLKTRNLCESAKNGGCGECQTSGLAACKTCCGIATPKCAAAAGLAGGPARPAAASQIRNAKEAKRSKASPERPHEHVAFFRCAGQPPGRQKSALPKTDMQ